MAAVRRGVDQPRSPVCGPAHVAPPEVTVDQCRPTRWEQRLQAVHDGTDRSLQAAASRKVRQALPVERHGVGAVAPLGTEVAPADPRRAPAEAWPGGRVQVREGAAEVGLGLLAPRPGFDPGLDQHPRLDGHDLGHRRCARDCREGSKALGFVRGAPIDFQDQEPSTGFQPPQGAREVLGALDRADELFGPLEEVHLHRL